MNRFGVVQLERVDLADVEWDRLDAFEDRTVFQTREWLEFLVATQGGEPVVARVLDRDEQVGWFTGMKVKRFGVPILGSPFRGWTSGPIGFNLREGISRGAAVEALSRFAFGELRCLYLELLDRRLAFDEVEEARHSETVPFKTFELDLSRSEEDLFAAMSSACRRAVRKSEKVGVHVEQASGEAFADEYYEQLEDVFAKQSLSPPYPVERVREMIRLVEPSGRLLMLRALSPDGEPIASTIFPVFKSFAYFWGGASLRSKQIMRPNEAIFWHAIRHVKGLGVPLLDLGGQGEYKRKYGGRQVEVPFLRRSRLPGLLAGRRAARKVYWWAATRK
ncbi:MAG TPA: GNAT family N-acetyltransferase [Solirubrobacterales bacterium]|nr:GNAT family N-acetyltransferase [Solirubrobacterales bacterium]